MKKYKKSTWLCGALFLYVTAMAIYLVPRNHTLGEMEKYVTIAVSYVIVLLLWLVLRKKEKLAERRRREMEEWKKDSEHSNN
jgi:high-affinity Fe2+/Pb2+ permease